SVKAQVLFSHKDRLVKTPSSPVHRIHHSHSDDKLHHALKRETFFSANRGYTGGVLGADTDATIEAGRHTLEFCFKLSVLQRTSERRFTGESDDECSAHSKRSFH